MSENPTCEGYAGAECVMCGQHVHVWHGRWIHTESGDVACASVDPHAARESFAMPAF